MFFLELTLEFILAFFAIFTWERIKLKISIPIAKHIKSLFFQLASTMIVAVLLVIIAIALNISFTVTGLIVILVTVFVWLHFAHYFPRV